MKVYRVMADTRICQLIQRDNHYELSNFDCTPKKSTWIENDWYIYNPIDPKSDFFSTGGATLVFDHSMLISDLYTLLEMSNEILEARIDSHSYFFVNVLNCINALDKKSTSYYTYPDGSTGAIQDYVFHPKRLGIMPPLFKIPETRSNEILCVEGMSDDPWDEFKGRYEKLNHSGLRFIKLFEI